MKNSEKKRILIVPLNWGLGHATRIIPIIRELLNTDCEVILGGSPKHLNLLGTEFPSLKTVSLPYLNIKLSGRSSQISSIALQIPKFLVYIIREYFYLKRLVKQHNIDAVISDNCYGLWNRRIPSVLITHQLTIKVPKSIRFADRVINTIHSKLIKFFDMCWVPDIPGNYSIAGELSNINSTKLNIGYVGLLSRFTQLPIHQENNNTKKQLLVLLSGPEPQRTRLENTIQRELKQIGPAIDITVVRGLPEHTSNKLPNWHNHLAASTLQQQILQADFIICRPGYSTLMDLLAMGKTACLVPTPGQTEQEYLAGYFGKKFGFMVMKQDEFSFKSIIELKHSTFHLSSDVITQSASLLEEQINRLLKSIK